MLIGFERRFGEFPNGTLAGAGFEPNLRVGLADVLEDEFVGSLGSFHHESEVQFGPVDDGDLANFLSRQLFDLGANRFS